MTILIIALKIIGTLLLLLVALVPAMAFIILAWYRNHLRKNGETVTGTVVTTRVVSNQNCNALPGHHFTIRYEYQVRSEVNDGAYTPIWRYRSKRASQNAVDAWPIGTQIAVVYDPQSPGHNLCELNSWRDLMFATSFILASAAGITLIWV